MKLHFLVRWDLGSKPKYFDHWKILADPAEKFNPQFLMENQKRIEGHSTDIITDLVIQWLSIRKKTKNPIFLWSSTMQPQTVDACNKAPQVCTMIKYYRNQKI